MRRRSQHIPGSRGQRRVYADAAARLRRDAAPGTAPARVADALERTTRRSLDPAVRDWFDRIEVERTRLLADDAELSGGSGRTSTVAQVTRQASVPRHQAALLFHLARLTGARRCLEMGTCVGVSGAYLGGAMELGGGGALRSLEGHDDRARVARRTWSRLGLADAEVVVGRFHRTLDATLATGPFDLAFVDGHHDGDATVAYTTRIRAACRPGAVLVLDDIDWSSDMRAAWEHLDGELSGSARGDLDRLGIIVLGERDAG